MISPPWERPSSNEKDQCKYCHQLMDEHYLAIINNIPAAGIMHKDNFLICGEAKICERCETVFEIKTKFCPRCGQELKANNKRNISWCEIGDYEEYPETIVITKESLKNLEDAVKSASPGPWQDNCYSAIQSVPNFYEKDKSASVAWVPCNVGDTPSSQGRND